METNQPKIMNPSHSYTEGSKVILDFGFANDCVVTVVKQTPQKLYTTVRDEDGNEWEVMTYRLSEINN